MYSLDFIDYLETLKEQNLEIQKEYILSEKKLLDIQEDMTEMIDRLEQINDTDGLIFKKQFKECEKAENEYRHILKIYEELENKLESVKEYIKIKLELNKDILEKYKDSSNKTGEVIKLLGGKTVQERIFQCEEALQWLEKDFRANKFEEMYTVFEKILGIERQRPHIKFEAKTNIYSYIDELGNEIKYNFFDKDRKLNIEITEVDMKSLITMAKEKGLSNKQIKKMDIYIATILIEENLDMFYNYIESIKGIEELEFMISYDLRTDGIKTENILTRKELNKIRKYAMRQRMIGNAIVIIDKSKLMTVIRIIASYFFNGQQYKNAITDGNNIK